MVVRQEHFTVAPCLPPSPTGHTPAHPPPTLCFLPRCRQVLVDGKNFSAALQDFASALRLTPAESLTDRARLLAGRALAEEGLGQWREALGDYSAALDLAFQGGWVGEARTCTVAGRVRGRHIPAHTYMLCCSS